MILIEGQMSLQHNRFHIVGIFFFFFAFIIWRLKTLDDEKWKLLDVMLMESN